MTHWTIPKIPIGGGFPALTRRLDVLFRDIFFYFNNSLEGWNDLLGRSLVRGIGANDPTWAVFRNTIRLYQFSNVSMNEMWFEYHIQHDVKTNPEMHLHVHWTQNAVDTGGPAGVPGTVKWYADMTYAKGHMQAAFPAIITTSLVQQASTTQYMHMLIETQIAAIAPNASQFDSALIEPDGILLVRLYRDPTDVVDTLNQAPFMVQCDVHIQVDRAATPNKAPPFV